MNEFTGFMCKIAELSGCAAGHFMNGNLHETGTCLIKINRRLDNAKSLLLATFDEIAVSAPPAEGVPE